MKVDPSLKIWGFKKVLKEVLSLIFLLMWPLLLPVSCFAPFFASAANSLAISRTRVSKRSSWKSFSVFQELPLFKAQDCEDCSSLPCGLDSSLLHPSDNSCSETTPTEAPGLKDRVPVSQAHVRFGCCDYFKAYLVNSE